LTAKTHNGLPLFEVETHTGGYYFRKPCPKCGTKHWHPGDIDTMPMLIGKHGIGVSRCPSGEDSYPDGYYIKLAVPEAKDIVPGVTPN